MQVFVFDVQDDVYYMVMELLEGDSLKARLLDFEAQGRAFNWMTDAAIPRPLLGS